MVALTPRGSRIADPSASSMLAHSGVNTTTHPTVNPFLNSSPHQPYMNASPAQTPVSHHHNSHHLDLHQDRALDDSLESTAKHSYFLKQHLDTYKLRDALKSASQMISELRTTQLGPQNYYELYNSVITELRELESYLRDDLGLGSKHEGQMNGSNGVSHAGSQPVPTIVDLYETVQHAGNILPRLYLLVTVASVYVEQQPDLTRDILYDLLELCKGVQHPIHGLFLRHHLLTMCKDKLPDDGATTPRSTPSIDDSTANDSANPQSSTSPSLTSISTSTVKDSIEFILQNFSSMTKLWVRIQQQRTADKVRRERERKNLKQLVGTNLVRLSELSSITIDVYTNTVLPRILQQIIDSKDTIAQEYLMEVLVHVFPAEYHLAALEPYLAAIRQLEPSVQIKDILIAMMNRLATFAKQTDAQPAQTEETAKQTTEEETLSEQKVEAPAESDEIVDVKLDEDEQPAKQPGMDDTTQKLHSTKLFNTFFRYVTQIVSSNGSNLSDALGMYVALLNFATNVYPQHPQYIDQIHTAALELVQSRTLGDQQPLMDMKTVQSIQQLLNIPLSTLGTEGILHLQHYNALIQFLPYVERRNFANQLMQSSIDQYELTMQPPEEAETEGEDIPQPIAREYTLSEVETLLQYVTAVVRDDRTESLLSGSADQIPVDELEHEQTLVCKWFYALYNSDTRTQLQIFASCRKQFGHGGPRRVGRTLQVLVQRCLQLLLSISHADGNDPLIRKLLSFTTETISALHATHSELALRLYLQSAQTINSLPNDVNISNESTIYHNVAAAFTVYEEDITENRQQISALTLLINTLMRLHSLSAESYETLTSKITQASARLLRKPDQCKAIASCAHLFWPVDDTVHKRQHAEENTKSAAQPENRDAYTAGASNGNAETASTGAIHTHRDAKRTLACLQKSLKIANSCIGQQQLELFLHLLQQYLYFYQHQCTSVQPKYLNGLVQLIDEQLSNGSIGDDSADDQKLLQWFNSVLGMLKAKQSDSTLKEEEKQRWNEITVPPSA